MFRKFDFYITDDCGRKKIITNILLLYSAKTWLPNKNDLTAKETKS